MSTDRIVRILIFITNWPLRLASEFRRPDVISEGDFIFFFVLLCHSKPPFEEVLAKLSKAEKGQSFSTHCSKFLFSIQKFKLQRSEVKKSYQIIISNSAQTASKMPFSTNDMTPSTRSKRVTRSAFFKYAKTLSKLPVFNAF